MEDRGGQGKARHAAHGAGRVLRKLLFYSVGNVTTGPELGCAEFGVRTWTSETKQSLVRVTRAGAQGGQTQGPGLWCLGDISPQRAKLQAGKWRWDRPAAPSAVPSSCQYFSSSPGYLGTESGKGWPWPPVGPQKPKLLVGKE